ncbi:17213_t:CDS:2, partial [Rhizophagus irregularis]
DAEHENSDSNIDYQVNIAQISLKLLINQVDWEDIMEIWHITYLIYRSNSTPHFRWFKLEIYGNTFNDSENFSNLNAFMNVNGNLLHVQLPTILDVLREENSIDNINMKIQVLEELYDTDKSIDESDLRKILNPHVSISSNTFIQDNNVYGSSSLQ